MLDKCNQEHTNKHTNQTNKHANSMKNKAQEGNQHTWCAGAIKSETKDNNQGTCDEKLQSKVK